MMNERMLWLTWGEIARRAQNRRLVYFGRGEWMEKARPYLPGMGAFIVDNSKYEQGNVEAGMPIRSPETLRDDSSSLRPPGFLKWRRSCAAWGLLTENISACRPICGISAF